MSAIAVDQTLAASLVSFCSTLTEVETRLRAAAVAADADGTGLAPPAITSFLDIDEERQKKLIGGSLLQLNDNTYVFTPIARAVVRRPTGTFWSVFDKTGAAATERSEAWLSANVRTIWPAYLTVGGRGGTMAAQLSVAATRASVEIVADPNGGTVVTHAMLSVHGMAPSSPISIAEAVQRSGMRGQPFLGGVQQIRVLDDFGVPDISTALAAVVPAAHLVGGGATGSIRVAKLALLGMPEPITCAAAATFLLGLTQVHEMQDALAVAIAYAQAAYDTWASGQPGRVAQPPEVTALLASRTALFESFGRLVDAMPHQLIPALAGRLATLATSGVAPAAGGCGSVITSIVEAHPPTAAAESPREAELRRLRAIIVATGGAGALTATLPPAPPPSPTPRPWARFSRASTCSAPRPRSPARRH